MDHEERDSTVRRKMLEEISEIKAFTRNVDEGCFESNRMMQKAVVMSLINIGELSKAFSSAYIARVHDVPWHAIRGFRNIAAHQYGKVDMADVWKTICEDIPALEEALLNNI